MRIFFTRFGRKLKIQSTCGGWFFIRKYGTSINLYKRKFALQINTARTFVKGGDEMNICRHDGGN